MTDEQFWDSTPRSFTNRVRGFYELEERRETMDWHRFRWLGTIILQPHTKKGKSIKPTDLFLFPEEQKQKEIDLSNERTKEIFRKMIERKGLKMPKKLQ